AVRLRVPRPRRALSPAHARPAAAVVPGQHSHRRAGAELRRRVQGRARQPHAERHGREAAVPEHVPLLRVLPAVQDRAAAARPQGARLGPLPPEGDRRDGRRPRAAEADGRRGRGATGGLLRARRLVGLRGGAPRPLHRDRRAGAPAERAVAARGRARRRERLLVQDADRAGEHRPPGPPPRAGDAARARARPRRTGRAEAGAARGAAAGAIARSSRAPHCRPRRSRHCPRLYVLAREEALARAGAGRRTALSGRATASRGRRSAWTPRKISTMPPATMIAPPMTNATVTRPYE